MSSSKNLEYKKTSFLNKSNSAFIEQMYVKYVNNDPNLPESWKKYFIDIGDDINSIVKEVNGPSWSPRKNKIDESKILENEIEILGLVEKYQETLNKAIFEIRPDIITNYLYKLSKLFHSYYAETKILTEDIRGERIRLVQCVDEIILNGLKVLDIEPMDSM